MKKKILFIITKSNWGGAQRYVFDLITTLPAHAFEKKILFGKSGEAAGLDVRIREVAKSQHIAFQYLPHLERDIHITKEIASALFLYRFLKKERPDIVHLNSSKAGGLGALAARCAGVPHIIFTAHGWASGEERPALQKAAITFLSWLTILLAHHTITLHERDFHRFDAWPFTRGKVVKIYNGVRDADGLSRTAAREALLKEYGVPLHLPLIGTVGELHKNKGHSYLLEAFASLKQEALLVIMGSGEERKAFEKKARSLGVRKRVFLTGFASGPTYMRGFDLFVFPSVKEGFPFAVLEAGMRDVPVIATAVGGVPEIIQTGTTGLLVAPKEPAELAQAMTLLLRDPSVGAQYAATLKRKIVAEFQFAAVTFPQTLALYRKERVSHSL